MFGRDEKVSAIRLTAAQYLILAIFLVLAYGLWRLQVMQTDLYATLAEKNNIRNVPILAPRGKILDREGRIIVDNYPSFSALLLRDSSRDLNADADLDRARACIWMRTKCAPAFVISPPCRSTSRSFSRKTLLRMSRPSSKRIATNCPNSIPSGPTGVCIRAMDSWRI